MIETIVHAWRKSNEVSKLPINKTDFYTQANESPSLKNIATRS